MKKPTILITNEPVSFSELWQLDSCGTKGYRKLLVEHIDKNKHSVFKGKTKGYVQKYLGAPNEINITEEWGTIHYIYFCDAYEIESNECGEAVNSSYHVNINITTNRVIDAVLGFH